MIERGERRSFPRNFRHLLAFPMKGPRDLLKWRRESRELPWLSRSATFDVPRARNDGVALRRAVTSGGAAVTWVGHASFVLQSAGVTALIDPVWSAKLPGGVPRFQPPGLAWEALPAVDVLLVTHNHFDHLDRRTVQRLPRTTPCLVPANEGARLRSWGFEDVREFLWWDAAEVAGVRFTFTPAQHWSRRSLFDASRSLWGGWYVDGGRGKRIYAAGDSGHFPGWREIAERLPPADVALLPAGAYEPRWFMREMHAAPEESIEAFRTLGAGSCVPFHWGTFRLGNEPLDEPPRLMSQGWTKEGLDPERLWTMAVGETRSLA